MSVCLVTTLKESVADNNLLKLGEMKIRVPSVSGDCLRMKIASNSNPVTITVSSPGYITDSAGTANLGQTTSLTTNGLARYVYLSAGSSYDIVIGNKYNLVQFAQPSKMVNGSHSNIDCVIDADDFSGASQLNDFSIYGARTTGHLSTFKNNSFSLFNLLNSHIEGDFAELDGDKSLLRYLTMVSCQDVKASLSTLSSYSGLDSLTITNCVNVHGNISGLSSLGTSIKNIYFTNLPNVNGNISSISNLTTLQNLSLYNVPVGGNLSSLATLTDLRSLDLTRSSVTGDTSSLANLTNLTTFTYTNTAIQGNWPLS